MKQIIESNIKSIIENSKDALFFHNARNEELKGVNNFPLVTTIVESSGINNYEGIENKAIKLYDVEMMIIEPFPKTKQFIQVGGKGVPESDLSFALRMSERREEMTGILEQIIYYLTDESYPFKYTMFSNIQFNNVYFEDLPLNVFGKTAIFTLQKNFKKQFCCVDFNEDAIKLISPNKC